MTAPAKPEPLLAFRSVHADFRSRNGYIWPFPGCTARATGPFDKTNTRGCPSHDGDGICLATTAEGAASGGIPLHTVLVCSYLPADVLGEEANGSKIRVRKARVLSVHDFPAVLRGVTPHTDPLPYRADLRSADLRSADLSGADLRSANLYGADLTGADLRSANLYGADLTGADLRSANLRSADLYRANLYGANLRSANVNAYTRLPAWYVVRSGAVVPA